MKFNTVILVGCGGTGSNLAINLVRSMQGSYDKFILFDGDKFEDKNITRQLFPKSFVGKSKARTIADEINRYLGIKIDVINKYLFGENLENLLKESELSLIVDCCDNNQTRKQILIGLEKYANNYVYVTTGNSQVTGNLISEARINGEYLTPKIIDLWREIGDIDERVLPIEDKWDCWSKAQGYEEKEVSQSLLANLNAGTLILNWLWNLQMQKRLYYYGRFDLIRNDIYLDDEMMIKLS